MAEGYHKRQEREFNLQWNQTRNLMALLKNIHRGEKDPIVRPEEVFPLSFDKKEEKSKPLTKEEQDKLIKTREKQEARRRLREQNKPS